MNVNPIKATSVKPLFPREVDKIVKPPALTSSSQPKLDTTRTDLATLPNMRKTGFKPSFSSEMKSNNPYRSK